MVAACAQILTCSDTRLDYRWEEWSGVLPTQDHYHDEPHDPYVHPHPEPHNPYEHPPPITPPPQEPYYHEPQTLPPPPPPPHYQHVYTPPEQNHNPSTY